MKTIIEVKEMVKRSVNIDSIKTVREYDVVVGRTKHSDGRLFIFSVRVRLRETAMIGNTVIYDEYHDFDLDEKKDVETTYNEVIRNAEEYIFDSFKRLYLAVNVAKKLGLDHVHIGLIDR